MILGAMLMKLDQRVVCLSCVYLRRASLSRHNKMVAIKELSLLSETPMLKREVRNPKLQEIRWCDLTCDCVCRHYFDKNWNYVAQCLTSTTRSRMFGARK